MPELTNDQVTLALAIVGAVAFIAIVVALVAVAKLRSARREYMVLRGEGGDRDILGAVGRSLKQADVISKRIDVVTAAQEEQATIGRLAMQRFALVRYDAFEDMGGRMSFSAALLDGHGDGIVITSINGRTETRTYAKPVKGLTSEHNLSGEERQAIERAAAGHDRIDSKTAVPR